MDPCIHVRPYAEAFGQAFNQIKLFGKYYLGMISRFALLGGKRVSDKKYYVNGFFESP